jgi:GNAT superfamily N-acetyltransferase
MMGSLRVFSKMDETKERIRIFLEERTSQLELEARTSVKLRIDDPDREPYSYFVQISIGSKEGDPFHDPECPHLDFIYHGKKRCMEPVKFNLQQLKGKGYGRKLVEIMEELGRRLGCSKARVRPQPYGASFWEHMGYKGIGKYKEKKL